MRGVSEILSERRIFLLFFCNSLDDCKPSSISMIAHMTKLWKMENYAKKKTKRSDPQKTKPGVKARNDGVYSGAECLEYAYKKLFTQNYVSTERKKMPTE